MLGGLPQIAGVRPAGRSGGQDAAQEVPDADILVVVCAGFSLTVIAAAAECARHHGSKVLLVIRSDQREIIDAVVTLPGDGFIMQDELTPACLERTLARMVGGEIPMPPAVTTRLLELARETDVNANGAKAYLTAREEQVLALLAEGLSNKQIARQLHITSHGVKRLVANILAKLHCPNRTLAVAIALRDGIIRSRLPVPDDLPAGPGRPLRQVGQIRRWQPVTSGNGRLFRGAAECWAGRASAAGHLRRAGRPARPAPHSAGR